MEPPGEGCSLFPSKPATKRFHGMRAAVVVKGEGPLKVHKMREGHRTVSGSVLGEAGKEFEVILWDGRHATRKGIEVKLYFADEKIACEWMPLQEAKNMVACEEDDEVRFWRWSSLRVDDYHVRRFRFAKVAVTDDDDDACSDDDFLINLSNIRIQVRRINPASAGDGEHTSMRNAMEYDPLDYADERLLHERSDKASFAMSASFGDLVEDELPDSAVGGGVSSFSYDYVDKDKVDLSFEFKICSAAAIDQLLAEEPLPPPRTIDDPEGVVRIVDSDDENEMAEYREAENRAYEAEQEDSDTEVEEVEDEDDPGSATSSSDSDGEYAPPSPKRQRRSATPDSADGSYDETPPPRAPRPRRGARAAESSASSDDDESSSSEHGGGAGSDLDEEEDEELGEVKEEEGREDSPELFGAGVKAEEQSPIPSERRVDRKRRRAQREEEEEGEEEKVRIGVKEES